VTPDKDYMLIAIQGPKYQKDKRDDENWLVMVYHIFTVHHHICQ